MTNDEYQQLIEFLGRKFEEIDRRFDRVEAKLAEHDDRFREISSHFDHFRTLFWSQPENFTAKTAKIAKSIRYVTA